MDNVVFETQTIPGFFDVTDIVPSKRLKIKPKSKENIENKIIGEEKEVENARLYLTKVVGEILKIGASLLGIEMPDKM